LIINPQGGNLYVTAAHKYNKNKIKTQQQQQVLYSNINFSKHYDHD